MIAKGPKQPALSFLELAAQAAEGKWECARCFVLNVKDIPTCAACDLPNPNAPAQPQSTAPPVSFGFGVGPPADQSSSAGSSQSFSFGGSSQSFTFGGATQSSFSFGGASQSFSFGGNTVSFGETPVVKADPAASAGSQN